MADLVGQPEEGRAARLGHLQSARSWSEYLDALTQCDESWRAEGKRWSVFGQSASYVHAIQEGQHIARRRNWIGLGDKERTILLGLRDEEDGVWGLLGTLVAAGEVKGVFNRSNEKKNRDTLRRIKSSVDRVMRASDGDFPGVAVKALEGICAENRFSHGAATRLLTLARPDKLVSVNSGSCDGLACMFDLAPSTLGKPLNYRRLLERLYETPWYNGPPGRGKMEQTVWNMRAALIDSFVYDPSRERRPRHRALAP